jgi:N-acetylmuramoyl-L-alanine amidase
MHSQDIETLARTLYGEARGEFTRTDGGMAALNAVANVVMNRVKRQTWFGQSISQVCLKPYQFSCWNASDPNRPLMLQADPNEDPVFGICLLVAQKVMEGQWPDLTKNSDHYYAVWMDRAPKWAVGHKPTVKIGQHVFYCLNPNK